MSFSRPNKPKVSAGLTASTTQTQGQGAIVAGNEMFVVAEVSTVANANDTVTLPAAVAGRTCLIINNGASTLRVYPATGANAGAGTNTAVTIAAGAAGNYVAFSSTVWKKIN